KPHSSNRPPDERDTQLPQVAGLAEADHGQLMGQVEPDRSMQAACKLQRIPMPAPVVPVIRRRPEFAEQPIAAFRDEMEANVPGEFRVIGKIALDVRAELLFLDNHREVVTARERPHEPPADSGFGALVWAAGIRTK